VLNKDDYCKLVENANSIIMRMDENGNITFLNDFGQNFFGFKPEEIIGKNVIGTIVPPADFTGQDLVAMIKDIVTNPQKYVNNENENITRDGRHVWISWTNKPIMGQDGKLQEILCIGNDISRLKITELELKKAKELAEAASNVGTIICSSEWKITAINSAAKRYFDLEGKDPSGQDIFSIIPKFYQPSILESEIRDISKTHQIFELVRLETKDNKALYLQVHKELLLSPREITASIVLSLHDISDQRREELIKQDFLGLISHKLRTPITIILQTAQMMEQGIGCPTEEQRKKLLQTLTREASKLNDLIANLLNFVTINRQDIATEKESVNIAEALPHTAEPMLNAVKDKKIAFSFDCPDKSLAIAMSRFYFDQMISNIISNVIKFNDKETIEIKISVRKEQPATVLEISDNGPGIPIEEQDKIFEEFYQIEKYFTGNIAGTGLGLPLVKKIVTAYGGTVSIKSDIGQGTTLKITLP